jgi:nitroreductase
MKLRDAIEGRKSVRRFHHKKPDWRKIIRAIDMARYAPSAGGQFVTKFILVSDEDKIAKITEATQQDFVGEAQYLVVVVSDETSLVRSYEERGKRYCASQSGAAIQNFLLALVEQKLVTTWVGHFYDEQVKDVLGVSDKMNIEAIFPIGVETARKTAVKNKTKLDNILFFDSYGNRKMKGEVKVGRDAC